MNFRYLNFVGFLLYFAASKAHPPKISNDPSSPNRPCLTKECVLEAARVLENMDSTVDPCEDFYTFACGNFLKTAVIPDDMAETNVFVNLVQKVKNQLRTAFEKDKNKDDIRPFRLVRRFYGMCTDVEHIEDDGLKRIKNMFEELGGWPVLDDDWDEKKFDWIDMQYQLRSLGLPFDGFLGVGIGTDFKNTSRRIVMIDEGSLGIDRENLVKGWDDKIVKAYYGYLVDIATIFGADKKEAKIQIKDAVDFEIDLAKLTLSKEEQRNISDIYHIVTIKDLYVEFPYVPWLKYITSLLDIDDVEISESEEVAYASVRYFKNLDSLKKKHSIRALANYMFLNVVTTVTTYLTEELRNRDSKFESVVYGTQVREPRWKECIQSTLNKFTQASGAFYVRKYFDHQTKLAAEELVARVKDTFVDILKNLEWMDDTTKSRALEKADAMSAHVAYPQEFLDDKVLEDYYSDLEISDKEEYFTFYLKIQKFKKDRSFSRLRQPVNKTDWRDHSSATDINAYYEFTENSLQLPAGILQGAFFDNDRPNYMNYGAMGYVIGHEITHGFDDMGRQFDKNGVLTNWWEDKTQKKFTEKAQCIVEQYGNYSDSKLGLHLNGITTQGENIADNGGAKEAYIAYHKWSKESGINELPLPGLNYTAYQLFWISTANLWCATYRDEYLRQLILTDSHSPSEFRILGSLSNSKYFAEDFNCPLNSPMNPEKKCQVW